MASKPGPWRNGVRREANRTWTAKYGSNWSRGHRTKAEAVQARSGLVAASKRPSSETVAHFAERWVRDFPREARSTNEYNAERITMLVSELGQKRLSEVSAGDAARFARNHPGRVRVAKALFNDASRDRADGLTANPLAHVKRKREDGRRHITALSRQEVDLLVQSAEEALGGFGRDVYGPMLTLAAWAGLRPAELFAVEWRDLDGDLLHVRRQWRSRTAELVPYTKNYLDRVVPLAPQVLEALERVPRVQGQEFVFAGRYGKRLGQRTNDHYFAKTRTAFMAKLPEDHWLKERVRDGGKRLQPYELRHHATTWLLEQGLDLFAVARFLGHQDEGELARVVYAHRSEDAARERVRQVLWGGEKRKTA